MTAMRPPEHIITENQVPTAPGFYRWTVERYHRLIESGQLNENDRLELMFGQIVPKMPIGELHALCLSMLNKYFVSKFGFEYGYRFQSPIGLLGHSEPEPDFAIVKDLIYDKSYGHPKADDIHLLIEISDTTLAYDRGDKARLFAMASIAEYWIINLEGQKLEVHLKPEPETGVYTQITHYKLGEIASSPFCGEVNPADLIPESGED
ncbi:MAG: Uma2 family endonuclease [Bacteroidota bacterium]